MSLREIEYNKVDGFSKLLIDYVSNSDHFNDLISDFPSIDNLNKQISRKSKNYDKTFRETLVKEIRTQYNDIDLTELQKSNIKKLAENKTFTITTGHQLNLLTGPMYFIYKIMFPILFLLFVCWSTFWINPNELESRVTITIVCLLSLIHI